MKKFLFIILVAVILVGGIFIISQELAKDRDKAKEVNGNNFEKISIVSTLFPIYDFAKEIGGDKVSVTLLLPPGLEAHSFEPKPSDIIKINKADIFLYSGELMEPWARDISRGLSGEVKVIDTSFGIEMIEELKHDDEDDEVNKDEQEELYKEGEAQEPSKNDRQLDPHIWLDFDNAKTIATTIAQALIQIDTENASYYQANLENYLAKLTALDNSYQTTLENCESREIIYGGHYTFGYLAKRYDLNYQSAQGFAPNSEPSANDLIYLIEEIKANDVKYVFYEELLSPKIAETLARETKTKLLLLNAAHNLSKDDYQAGLTFILIMENNLENLSVGLNCELK
ncbi:zinc ABC transporter solute-binding protein [Candidatus Falkowbacteria bacterium]|nr:zinc ABC transporter solute-binding protein [Candidatus Falkowbacteria bacterium]